jgi:N-acetylglucosaminyl-diphospho-decaprenol L-rhamnosyltransferase
VLSAADLSIIIVTWNVRDYLSACLDSIRRESCSLQLEVIVVDSGSDDNTVEMLREQYDWVTVLPQSDNVGFTRGCNLGLAAARGYYLMLLNPDTEIIGNALERLASQLRDNPDIGIVGPHTLNADGTPQASRRHFPTLATFIYESPSFWQYTPKRIHAHYFAQELSDTAMGDVDWVQGSALMARREVLDQIGPLDTDYFMFFEEADWCKRARDHGWRVVYVGDTTIVHYGGKSTNQVPVFKQIYYQRSKLRYVYKFSGPLPAFALRLVLILSYLHQISMEAAKAALGSRRELRRKRIGDYKHILSTLVFPHQHFP